MGYKYWHKGITWGGQVGAVMSYGVKHRLTSAWALRELDKKGLTYRRQDMLYDYRRTEVIGLSKTLVAHYKAEDFFENVIERLRVDKKTTQKGAFKIWEELRRKQEELEEFTPEELEWWSTYEELW